MISRRTLLSAGTAAGLALVPAAPVAAEGSATTPGSQLASHRSGQRVLPTDPDKVVIDLP